MKHYGSCEDGKIVIKHFRKGTPSMYIIMYEMFKF